MENIYGYLFGAQKSTMSKSAATDNQDFYNSQSSVVILEAAEKQRQKNMNKVKTFNMVKNAAWNCVLQDESDDVKKEDQKVNLVLMRELMQELMTFVEFYELVQRHDM